MSKKEKNNTVPEKAEMGIYVALDLGSTEIRGIAAKKDDAGNLVTIATETEPSTGMKHGAIQNVEVTKTAISRVLANLENRIKVQANKGITDIYDMVDVKIENVYVALNGLSIQTATNTVRRRLNGNFITDETLEEYVSETRDTIKRQNPGLDILDIQPIQYIVNDDHIANPVGCSCEVFCATYKVFLGYASLLSNLKMCIEGQNRNLAGYCLAPLAAANATVSANEKELGIVALDFGHTTTNVSVFYKGQPHYAFVIPIGSNLMTKDIAQLRIVEAEADKIKTVGNCNVDRTKPDFMIGLSNGKDVSYLTICEVIERRIDTTIDYIKEVINDSKLRIGPQLDQMVILGNGSNLRGLKGKLEREIGLPVHDGKLLDRYSHLVPTGKDNSFHVAIGTLLTATQNCAFSTKANERPVEKKSKMNSLFDKIGSLFDTELPEDKHK